MTAEDGLVDDGDVDDAHLALGTVRTTSAGIIVVDTDWRVRLLSPGTERMLALDADEVIGKSLEAIAHPSVADTYLEGAKQLVEIGEHREFDFKRRDGTVIPLGVTWSVIEDDDGEVIGYSAIGRDISERTKLQEALEEALRQEHTVTDHLRRLDDMRRTFLQAVSHELRTPLTSLLGFATTLRDRHGELSEDRAEDLLRRLTRNAERLGGLLDDLLDVDRLSRGIVEIDRREVDVGEVVRRAAGRVSADDVVEIDAPSLRGSVDPLKVERIVENLVVNALKHGGDVSMVTVALRRDDDHLVLTVADDGRGVPDEFKQRIFDPFEQGRGVAAGASPGTGVGLSLVSEFARLHGGDVSVHDRDGGGALFRVTLPVE